MSEIARIVDGAIGETREALVIDGRVAALRILRASDDGRRARWGELYNGRIAAIDRRRRGAFVDLGLKDGQGFLPLDSNGRVGRAKTNPTEGQRVVVSVAREAARGKAPVLALQPETPSGDVGLILRREEDEDLMRAPPADASARDRIDAAIEEALARMNVIPGGGALTIEPTAALVAVDVDSGARQGAGDPERFALDLNIAAAAELARQLRLRALGGVICVDFVNLRQQSSRKALETAIKAAFARDPWGVRLGMLSRFGIMELQRPQLHTPLHEILRDSDGRASVETVALAALRAVEREARAQAGRRIAARLASEVFAWLEATAIPWRAALTDRIGPRFTFEAAPGAPRDRIDVRAL